MSKYDFIRPSNYVIDDTSPRTKYIQNLNLKNVHWGQLKLFCNELMFLNLYYDPAANIKDLVYIGAAGGHHLDVLTKLYPDLHFHLYDTGKFYPKLERVSNITIYNKYFTDEDVQKWKLKQFYMVSDIRSLSYDSSKNELNDRVSNEELVWSDMRLQKKWVEIMKPRYSMLKFRLPYAESFELEKGSTRMYLDGTVYIQPFCKKASSETRLVIDGDNIYDREWDLLEYEEKMAFHNKIVRNERKFYNPLDDKEHIFYQQGLYNDYDSAAFTNIVIDYMTKVGMDVDPDSTREFMKNILNNINGKVRLTDFR